MSISDRDYFVRRAAEERSAAERAQHPEVQRLHLDLARRYEAAAALVIGTSFAEVKISEAGAGEGL